MALNWSVGKCDDHLALFEEGDLNPRSKALVMMSMPLGFNEITQKNLDEVWTRVRLWEGAHGAVLWGEGPEPFTKKDIIRHLGMNTNATRLTTAQFLKRLWASATES